MSYLNNADVVKLVNAFCDQYATFALAAKALRCTPAQLSQARLGRLGTIPAPILKKLGLKSITLYVGKRSGKTTVIKAMKKPAYVRIDKKATLADRSKPPRPPKGFVHVPPSQGETPALQPTPRVLSLRESDFDEEVEDTPDFTREAPSIHINAFGED